jgi:hypothetical protein
MRKCQTIMLRIGGNSLTIVGSGSTATNIMLQGVFYNPATQLSNSEATITSYAIYLTADKC